MGLFGPGWRVEKFRSELRQFSKCDTDSLLNHEYGGLVQTCDKCLAGNPGFPVATANGLEIHFRLFCLRTYDPSYLRDEPVNGSRNIDL